MEAVFQWLLEVETFKYQLGEEKGSEWGNGVRKEDTPAKGTIICKRSGDQEGERIDLFED